MLSCCTANTTLSLGLELYSDSCTPLLQKYTKILAEQAHMQYSISSKEYISKAPITMTRN